MAIRVNDGLAQTVAEAYAHIYALLAALPKKTEMSEAAGQIVDRSLKITLLAIAEQITGALVEDGT